LTDEDAPVTDNAEPSPVSHPSVARAVADRYVDIVNRGEYDELCELFAVDAVFYAPGHRVLRGRDEIRDFYTSFLPTITPTIRIAQYVEQGDHCVYELEARTGDDEGYTLGAIDHATLDADGKIARFAVFVK
jgi:hypothetical protein